jgi:hypothetical protein
LKKGRWNSSRKRSRYLAQTDLPQIVYCASDRPENGLSPADVGIHTTEAMAIHQPCIFYTARKIVPTGMGSGHNALHRLGLQEAPKADRKGYRAMLRLYEQADIGFSAVAQGTPPAEN